MNPSANKTLSLAEDGPRLGQSPQEADPGDAPSSLRKAYAAFTLLLNVVPGLGHLAAGRPAVALLWCALTLMGYSLYVLPGLFLHAWCTWSLVKYWHEELGRDQQQRPPAVLPPPQAEARSKAA